MYIISYYVTLYYVWKYIINKILCKIIFELLFPMLHHFYFRSDDCFVNKLLVVDTKKVRRGQRVKNRAIVLRRWSTWCWPISANTKSWHPELLTRSSCEFRVSLSWVNFCSPDNVCNSHYHEEWRLKIVGWTHKSKMIVYFLPRSIELQSEREMSTRNKR